MKVPEIISVGEAIIDLVSTKPAKDLASASQFTKIAGGAPANVAVGLAHLGIRTAFLGKVGRDSFGRFIKQELRRRGVATQWIVEDPQYKTRLAFVAVDKKGNRNFEFWENDPADQHLKRDEIDLGAVCKVSIINISAFLLLNAETKKTAFAIARHARKRRTWVCFDPNIRISLWSNKDKMVQAYHSFIRLTTILRLNEDEAMLLTGAKNRKTAANKLLSMGPQLVVITRDKHGCFYATPKITGDVKGFSVNAVDTTGCGDGFLAGLLAGIVRSKKTIGDLTGSDLNRICTAANAVGALVATKRGAIAAMPSQQMVNKFIRRTL